MATPLAKKVMELGRGTNLASKRVIHNTDVKRKLTYLGN